MYIHEAIKARTADKPFITREIWLTEYSCLERYAVKILPTNTPDGMVCVGAASRSPCRGWQPDAEDLSADDWTTAP